ncbi:MAG: HAMP domain-containing histidine kinase [Planctomycetaceae bacterium]|jgi:signal transduction histidine kinase|nr:HAMP domain-containing histidine kinase [Planctomycetaceae bacterium]
MTKRRSIRFTMWTALTLLFLLVFLSALAGHYAVSLYKKQVRDIAWRAKVLPVAGKLSGYVSELRTILSEFRGIRQTRLRFSPLDTQNDRPILETKFQKPLFGIEQSYREYRQLLNDRVTEIGVEDGFKQEFSTVNDIRRSVETLKLILSQNEKNENRITDATLEDIDAQLTKLQQLANTLPNYLHEELKIYSQTMKQRARWLNAIAIISVTVSAVLTFLLIRISYIWIFKPLGQLIEGSRKVVDGTFQYRIRLQSQDEMAELAEAMNRMTQRFEDIRDDLDNKVRERSRELVRSERLASVGFLAAGVAHEINNPLMAISTCAESLQRRIVSVLAQNGRGSDETEYVKRYLKMIQDEAFRCKGITEKLLSFARSERQERQRTDFVSIIMDIVEITRQHDAFKQKEIRLDLPKQFEITVNPQEMKQVVLNLLTNALHSTNADGIVTIKLRKENAHALLTVEDNGIGMDESVLKNIFEPFFTRREHGQGTGLGLSITYRIIEDHHGRIEAYSKGSGYGSTFVVELPVDD